jgi:hypothetical protein
MMTCIQTASAAGEYKFRAIALHQNSYSDVEGAAQLHVHLLPLPKYRDESDFPAAQARKFHRLGLFIVQAPSGRQAARAMTAGGNPPVC